MRENEASGADSTRDPTGDPDGGMGRRGFVAGLAASVGATGLLSGHAAAESPVPDRVADTFERTIDVTDAGVDDTGETSITGRLERLRDDGELQDGTLLYFPPGRYYVDRQFRMTGFENFGMYGDGATLVPADYHHVADGQHRMFVLGRRYNPGARLVVENFTVDMTAPDTGSRVIDAAVSDRLDVRDVEVEGRHDSGTWGPGRFVVTDPSGTGSVRRFRAPEGGAYVSNAPHEGLWRGPTGILCNTYNRGRMTFRDCELGGFPDNGLYAAGSEGPVRVWRGRYRNSNGASVRVGGTGSELVDVDVVVDRNWADTAAQRGIRVEKSDGLRIENCRVHNAADTPNSHGVSVQHDAANVWIEGVDVVMEGDRFNHGVYVAPGTGDVTLYDSRVELDTPGGAGIRLRGEGTDDEEATVAQVEVTGDAGHKWNRSAIYNTRNNVEFRVVRVDQTGSEKRNGLENFGDDCLLYLCDVRSRQYPYAETAGRTWVESSRFRSTDGNAGVRLTDTSSDVVLKRNTIHNDVQDEGCTDVRLQDNTVP